MGYLFNFVCFRTYFDLICYEFHEISRKIITHIKLQFLDSNCFLFYFGKIWDCGSILYKKNVMLRLHFILVLRARSRLYWRRSLHMNTHCSTFFVIYKTCIFLHRFNLSNLANFRQHFWWFFSANLMLKELTS